MMVGHEGERHHLRDLAVAILQAHPALADQLAAGVAPAGFHVTPTGMALVLLAVPGAAPNAILKLPLTPPAGRALWRESHILVELQREERLADWRLLLPRVLARGVVGGRCVRIDAVLPGRPLDVAVRRTRRVETRLEAAAQAITPLHRATTAVVRVDGELAARWVDAHVDTLARCCHSPELARRLERLRAELRAAVVGRELTAGWIHGDLWLGNVLACTGPGGRPIARGIVDWETAAPRELALHDLLHLVMYTRRLRTGGQLGPIVRRQIERPAWSRAERDLLDRHGTLWGHASLPPRHALLLYWIRQAATHARQQPEPSGYRYRLWERRNVTAVVAAP